MIGTIGIILFLALYLLIQNKQMKKVKGERKKVLVISMLTSCSALLFITPYNPGALIQHVNQFFRTITSMVISI